MMRLLTVSLGGRWPFASGLTWKAERRFTMVIGVDYAWWRASRGGMDQDNTGVGKMNGPRGVWGINI
jgi:hypothetical protein